MDIQMIQDVWNQCMRKGNAFPKSDFGGWCMYHIPDASIEWVTGDYGVYIECIVAGVLVLKIPDHHLCQSVPEKKHV